MSLEDAEHHLAKAARSLNAVASLLANDFSEQAASDAYYSAFHVVRALLAASGFEAETHAGVRTLLAQHFVRDGTLPSPITRDFARLLSDRLLADYGIAREIDADGARDAALLALVVVRPILDLLEGQLGEANPDLTAARAAARRLAASLPGAD